MYRPTAFWEDDLGVQHELIRQHPLGLLVTPGLLADPIPFVLDSSAGEFGVLRGHLAKANPQYQALALAEECLVVFQGPQAYITPQWYATKQETGKVVPTWNYATVHVWGRPVLQESFEWLRAQIGALTELMEGQFTKPWSVDDAPTSFVEAQMKGIFGVEIAITRMEGKWKVSQNRSEEDRAWVVAGLTAMSSLVAERGGNG